MPAHTLQRFTRRAIRLACMCAPLPVAAALSLLLPANTHAQRAINWAARGHQFALPYDRNMILQCPPNGTLVEVWGTDVYTDDSSICTAALHAGLITLSDGGMFVLRKKPGQAAYTGSVRNGVTTRSYAEWDASFTVGPAPPPPIVRALERPAEPPAAVSASAARPAYTAIPWDRTAARLAPNGQRFTFLCAARGPAGVVKGGAVYSWDSSICSAAVHAGAITLARGGVVTIEMRPGSAAYASSTRNGITSGTGARTTLGFVVIRNAPDRSRE